MLRAGDLAVTFYVSMCGSIFIARPFIIIMPPVCAGHSPFVFDDVNAVPMIGRFLEKGSPMHDPHVVVFRVRVVVADGKRL